MGEFQGRLERQGGRFAIVVSRYNELITDRLLGGARACFAQHGVAESDIDVIWVPGAWELPLAAQRALGRGGYSGVVALGCVIRGETPHFDFVAGEAARGLAAVSLGSGVPIAFGVLTTNDADQALARAGGDDGNKGWEAALSALEMASLCRELGAAGEGA